MDINQLIADLQEISQKNSISHYKRDRCAAAATALSTLQVENQALRNAANGFKAENDKLRAELEQVKRERDAAVEQLHGVCSACMNYSPYHNRGKCRFCVYEPARDAGTEVNDNWQCRGPAKEG